MKEPTPEEIKRDYWPCACVNRDRKGNLSGIKLHHKSVHHCRVCGIGQDGEIHGGTKSDRQYIRDCRKLASDLTDQEGQ